MAISRYSERSSLRWTNATEWIQDKLEELSRHLNIGLSIKEWSVGRPPLLTELAKDCLRGLRDPVAPVVPLQGQRGKCLFSSVAYHRPGHQFTFCREEGPHSVKDALHALTSWQLSSLEPKVSEKYVFLFVKTTVRS